MSVESRPGGSAEPVLVGLAAAAAYAAHGFDGRLNHDLGVFVYGGIQVADGVPPYVGIFNSVGPLADLVPGAAIWAGRHVGLDPVLAARLLFTVLAAACCALVYALAREVLRSRAGGLVAAVAFLAFRDFLLLAANGPREKTTMVLFLLCALLLVVRRRWLGAGACTALATLTWQPVLAVAVVAAGIGMATGPRRVGAAAAYVAGGVVPTAAMAAYLAAHGHLDRAVDGFLVVNLATDQPSVVGQPRQTWRFLWQGYHLSLWLVLAGLVAVVVVAAVRRTVPLAVVAGGALAGVAWTTYSINGAPDLFVLLPFAAIGVAAAVVTLADGLRPPVGFVLIGVVTAGCVALAVVDSVQTRTDGLSRQRADVRAVLAAAPPGATVLSLDAPEVLALSDRRNPSSYQLFTASMRTYLDDELPGGLPAFADEIAAEQPTLIVTRTRELPDWARPALHTEYRRVGRGPGWTWWIARSTGRAAAAAVIAANRVAHGARD